MKIAFVTYPTAAILPPYHGSMGATIYAIARDLAKTCDVVVYGLADSQLGAESGNYDGVDYRSVPLPPRSDRLIGKSQKKRCYGRFR